MTKAQRMQMKVKSNKSTAHNSKNDACTTAKYDKSHQNTVSTHANYESTKNANQSAKPTKYYAQTKMLHELLPDMKKQIKILWAHRLITKAQRMHMKAQKQQSTAHNSKNE